MWRGHFWQRDFSRRSLGVRFLQSLRKDDGTNFSENTINHIHSAASSIFTLAVELEYIDHNPWHDIKKRNVASVDPEEGAAYSELVETLIENLGLETTARNRRSIEMAQLVLAIGIWAGLRPSEIAALRYEDIDLDKGTILVLRGHVYGKTKPSTKTGKERLVYYLSPLAGRLRLWFSENQKTSIHGWLFENRDGNPIHLNSMSRRIIAPIAKKYGTLQWEDNAFYGARRGFGTLLVLSGASCEEVAKQMGKIRDVVWKRIEKLAQERYPQVALLKQVKGVGTLIALTFFLTLEDAHRFRKSRDVCCYLGLQPGRRNSGQSQPQMHISKEGDPYPRTLLVQGAQHILGPFGADCDLRRWGLKLDARGGRNGKKGAIIATARKLAVLLHRLWVSGKVYEPLRNCNQLIATAA